MAVTDQSEAIWKSIRTRLLADSAVAAALGSSPSKKIVRRALPGDALPCIICTSIESADRGTDDSDAETVRIELHIWGSADDLLSGEARAAVLKGLVKTSLHWAPIGTRCTVEAMRGPLPDPDPKLHHFVVVVETISEHVAL